VYLLKIGLGNRREVSFWKHLFKQFAKIEVIELRKQKLQPFEGIIQELLD